jgi:hypothetical protein
MTEKELFDLLYQNLPNIRYDLWITEIIFMARRKNLLHGTCENCGKDCLGERIIDFDNDDGYSMKSKEIVYCSDWGAK